VRRCLLLAALLWSVTAAADLYRWVDPETGSVKFSSYPPPWYGDEKLERRAPRVEHIPPRGPGGSGPVEPPAEGSKPPVKPAAGAPARPAPGEQRPGT